MRKAILIVGLAVCLCACSSMKKQSFNWEDANYSVGKVAKAGDS